MKTQKQPQLFNYFTATDEQLNYNYDYLNGMKLNIPKSHDKIKRRINEKIGATLTKTLIILGFIMMGLGFASCERDVNTITPDAEPKQELISQSFYVKTILEKDIQTKGFNPDAFIVEFSDIPTTLKLQSTTKPTQVYTKVCTAQELVNGTITMSIIPDNYIITFESVHPTTLIHNKMDISINEQKLLQGSPVTLSAVLKDFLVIYDVQSGNNGAPIESVLSTIDNSSLIKQLDYYYGYAKDQTNLLITFGGFNYPAGDGSFPFQASYTITQNLPNMEIGKLYWVLKGFQGTFTIDIPKLLIEQIII